MKFIRLFTILLLLLNGFGAIYGGWNLMRDPTGSSILLPSEYIEHTVFKNYLIPGIVLFVMNGMLSLATCLMALKKSPHYGRFVIIQGIILLTWLIVQLLTIKVTFFLQLIYGIIGLLFILFGVILLKKEIIPAT